MHTIGHIHLGPAWKPGVPVTAQGEPMEQHLRYMKELFDRGSLILGGPYDPDRGGIAVFDTETFAEAQSLADGDPANQADVIGYRLERLHTVFDAVGGVDRSDALGALMTATRQSAGTMEAQR